MIDPKPSKTSPTVHHDLHLANSIASPCVFDTKDSFFSNIEFYPEKNYTYAPFPFDGEYYDFDEGEIKAMSPGQWVNVDHYLITAIEKLLEHDFLLVDRADFLFEMKEDELNKAGIGEAFRDKTEEKEKEEDTNYFRNPKTIDGEYPEYKEKALEIAEREEAYYIITLADVNRRPVKDMLYPLIASTESIFKNLIHEEYSLIDDVVGDMKPRSIGRWKKAELDNIQMHPSEYMNLAEMKKIIGKSEKLRSELGFESRNQFKKGTKGIIDLRNDVMHASRTLVRNKSELESLNSRINRLEDIIKRGGGEINRRDQSGVYED